MCHSVFILMSGFLLAVFAVSHDRQTFVVNFVHVSTDYALRSFASLLAVVLLCIIFAVDLRRRILFFQLPRAVSCLSADAKNIYCQCRLDL